MKSTVLDIHKVETDSDEQRQTLRIFTAIAAFGGGLVMMLVGLVMTLIVYFESVNLHRLETICLVSGIILLMVGSHVLDRIDDDRKKKGQLTMWGSIAVLIGFFSIPATAQQTIFNVPTSDVLDQGKVYVELDAAFKLDNRDQYRRFSSFVPRIVVGTGGNFEVGLNVTGNVQPGADSTAIVPTVKWKFYQNEKKDTALFAGTNVFIPVRNRSYNIGTYSYAAVSKTINKTRLTGGGFVASKNVFAANAVRAGGQFGVEQTVNSKFTFAADWITGRHASGFFTPGVIYKLHPKVTTYWSYSIGNADAAKGNHFFLFEVGYNFN